MKKILIASYSLGFGGIETSLINLLKNFDLKKYKVTLVLEKKEGVYLNDVPKEVEIKEYKVSTSSNFIIRKIKNLINRIKWIIKNYNKYDASISYATYSGPCGFVARTASKNSILYVHSNYYEAFDKNKDKTINFFNNLKINKYNHVIFVSNESKNDVAKLIPSVKENGVVINNIVDYKKILELSEEKINEKIDNKKIFLFVGRLDESSKRLTLLLDVARKCKDKKANAIFWIIGDGPDEKLYKKIVKDNKLDNVIFYESKKNPYPYMKMCNYLILSSRYEGFPVVYNEAIVLNKQIVTTIDVSDDFISIKDRFGYVVNKENIYDKVIELCQEENKLKEKVDFDKLNKKRIKDLEKIMESK